MKIVSFIKHYWLLLLSIILFILHQVLQKILHIRVKFADSFLDPFLLPLIVLSFLRFERRLLQKKARDYVLPVKDAVAAIILIAVFSECLFPFWNRGFTRDGWDLIAYSAGTAIFLLWMNKPYPNNK